MTPGISNTYARCQPSSNDSSILREVRFAKCARRRFAGRVLALLGTLGEGHKALLPYSSTQQMESILLSPLQEIKNLFSPLFRASVYWWRDLRQCVARVRRVIEDPCLRWCLPPRPAARVARAWRRRRVARW